MKKIIFKPKWWSFLVTGSIIVLLGAIAKIQHYSFANILLVIGLIFEIFGIYFIFKNFKITENNSN